MDAIDDPSQDVMTSHPHAPKPFYKQWWFSLGGGVLVSVVCLYFALKDVPYDKFVDAFRQADYRTLPLIWLILFLFYWLKAIRWRLMLRPVKEVSTGEAFKPVLIGFAFNNVLPAHLGEFVRVFVFSRQQNVKATAVLSTVVLERVFDIIAILFFFTLGLTALGKEAEGMSSDVSDVVQATAWTLAGLVVVAIVGAIVFLIWTQPFVRLFEGMLAKLPFVPESIRGKVCHILEAGAEGLSSLKSWPLLGQILVNSLVQWSLNGLLMYLSLQAFGIEVSFLATCLLLGVVAFGVTIPSSPGYFGVINILFVAVINERTFGVIDEAGVVAASFYYHIGMYIPVTLLGMWYFNQTGLSVSRIAEQKEIVEESETENELL